MFTFRYIKAIAPITGISLLLTSTLLSAGAQIDFSDPASKMQMDDAWLEQPIQYDKKSGDVDMVVTLGQQTYPALRGFIEEYARDNDLKVSIEPGSCGVTAKKLRIKSADVGAYCCPPGKTDRLPGIEFHTIGVAPIALVTHPDNPVENLSLQDARDVFSGQKVRWSEVPAEKGLLSDAGIQPVARMHCKKRPGHWRGLLQDQDAFSARVREVGVIPDMITNVAGDDNAIGYETLYMLEVYKEKGDLKPLSIDGMHPSELNHMVDASYPVYRTYNLTSWADSDNTDRARTLILAVSRHIEQQGHRYGIVPASKLRQAGWKFKGDELVGEPDGSLIFTERE